MTQPWPTFITAQRDHCTLNPNRTQFADASLWTAGRCQRLLCPIISWIELLKKDRTGWTTAEGLDSVEQCEVPAVTPNSITTKNSRKCEDDGCWGRPRKRARKTYSVRRKMQDISTGDEIRECQTKFEKKYQFQSFKLQPGEVSIPTPILKRSRSVVVNVSPTLMVDSGSTVSSASSKTSLQKTILSHHTKKGGENNYDLAESMRQVKKKTGAVRFKVYEGIYNSLEVLLKVVTPHGQQVHQYSPLQKFCRSRSLFGTCLRRIPSYMKEQEKWFALDTEAVGQKTSFDTSIILADKYADLQSFGTSHGGWKHLKTVVRAHGIKVICDAIEDCLLDSSIASVLAILCVHMSVPEDAETILISLLRSCEYPAPKSLNSHFRDDLALLPLLTLERFFKLTGSASFYHSQVMHLLVSGSLAVTWLGTKQFATLWTSLFHSLSTNPFDRVATEFMINILPLLYRAQSSHFEKYEYLSTDQRSILSVLDTTLASVCATILALGKLSNTHMKCISCILKGTIIDCKLVSSEVYRPRAAIIVTANLLSGTEIGGDIGFVQELMGCLGNSSNMRNHPIPEDIITSFICSVAQCYGKATFDDAFEHLKAVIQGLMAIESDDPEGVAALQKIAVHSAFAFAGNHPDARHLQYAMHLKASASRFSIKSKALPNVFETDPVSGFRWEEGINEWIMATPTLKVGGNKKRALSLVNSDSDCDSLICVVEGGDEPAPSVKDRVHSGRRTHVSDFILKSSTMPSSNTLWPGGRHHICGDDLRIQNSSPETCDIVQPALSKRGTIKSRKFVRNILWSNRNYTSSKYGNDELSINISPYVPRKLPNAIRYGSDARRNVKLRLRKPNYRRRHDFQRQSGDELGLNF